MKRRLIPTIVFSVLLLAVVIAAGVHILHKKAYAGIITFRCYIHDGEVELTEEDVELEIHIWSGEELLDAGFMNYSSTTNFYWEFDIALGEWTHWDVFIADNNIEPVNPPDNPALIPHQPFI